MLWGWRRRSEGWAGKGRGEKIGDKSGNVFLFFRVILIIMNGFLLSYLLHYASKNVPSLRKEEVWKSAFCGSYLFSSSPSLSSFTQSASLTITITPEYKCASSKPSKTGKFDVKDDFLSRPLVSPVSNALMLLFINGFDKLSHKFNNMVQPTPIMPWNSPSSPHTHLVETYSNLT